MPLRTLGPGQGLVPSAEGSADPGRARLRRQPPRLGAVRPVRPEPRADRAPARRRRRAARQSRHPRRLARRGRAGAARARRPLRAGQARPATSQSGDVEGAIRLAIAQGSLFDFDPATRAAGFEEINLRKRPVRARTAAQDAYIRALRTPRAGVRHRPGRHRQDLARGGLCGRAVRAQGGRPHHPVAARGRGRRAARLPARRPAREGRSVSAADVRRAVRPDGRAHRRARAADRTRSRSRRSPSCAAARCRTPSSSSTRRRTPPRCR